MNGWAADHEMGEADGSVGRGRTRLGGSWPGKLLVFAKAPVAGTVKTRLGRSLGAARAARLAEAFLMDTWAAMSVLPGVDPVLVLDGELLAGMLAPEPPCWAQGPGDLGARLERAFTRALTESPWAIAVGTDSPGLPPKFVLRAARELSGHGAPNAPDREGHVDAVLGPSEDGGYYLIGLRRCPPRLFEGVRWSVETTFKDTLQRLSMHGFSVHVLDAWFDVDEARDLERLRRELYTGAIEAPATRRLLERL